MGVDFIRKAAPTHRKSWDRARVDLGTPDLFTRQPDCCDRTVAASLLNNQQLQEGDTVIIQAKGSDLIVMQGLSTVAQVIDPPLDLVDALILLCQSGSWALRCCDNML
jgi:hypothetical protein